MTSPRRIERTPAELFGPLFRAVQERGILHDGKIFVDAVPNRSARAILCDFAEFQGDDAALLEFVTANFDLPPKVADATAAPAMLPLRDQIRAMWPALARGPNTDETDSSALALGHRHVVPGGRFREMYYWDSFFTMLGLLRDGERELATGIVDTLTDLIETQGYVPNGMRTYYLGRSQPPLFHMMVALLDSDHPSPRRLAAMKREHAWWMDGAAEAEPGTSVRRVARLADGSLLNRYWDPATTPRDESWREDIATARSSGRSPEEVYRELRAGAESGWDFSSRWLDDGSLGSIRITSIAPVDLNAFLYSLETAIADAGGPDAPRYRALAEARRAAIQAHLWDDRAGCFCDYDLELARHRSHVTAAIAAPLLVGLATQEQADASARVVRERLLAPGGLRTTTVESWQQWDSPNGWAPLQWIAVAGLAHYGHDALAREIAKRWVATVSRTYRKTGLFYEKYNVENGTIGAGGEYAPQHGFGWTNGVTADFIEQYGLISEKIGTGE